MFTPKYLIVLTVFSFVARIATCDYYSSVSGLEVLLDVEGDLLDFLKGIIEKNPISEDGDLMVALGSITKEYEEAENDWFAYLSNPISAFKLIKRFVVDWSIVQDSLKDEPFSDDVVKNVTELLNDGLEPPTEDDLKGAALGLVRLQETYSLNATDLAEGKLLGTKYGSEMSASDCFELGMSLYEAGEFKRSLPWVLEAFAKLKQTSYTRKRSMTEVLRYLSVIYFQLENPKMALLLTNEILKIDPENEGANENKKVYEEYVIEQRNSRKLSTQPLLVTPKEPSITTLYEMTCRGERHQTPTEQRPLRCMYTTNGVPYRLIGPFKLEQLNLDPLVVYYHQVISDSQIERSINEAESIIARSKVGDLKSTVSEIRISKTGWLYYEHHEYLGAIASLLKDVTGLSLDTAEALQIVNYGIGGHYGPHFDFSDTPLEAYGEWRGNRIATALFYINDVELGGGTAFPFLKLTVPPVKGSLVLWYNLHDSLEPDYRTKHAGCPVLKGSKWILNEWFHERGQEFLKPCGAKTYGDLYKHYQYLA